MPPVRTCPSSAVSGRVASQSGTCQRRVDMSARKPNSDPIAGGAPMLIAILAGAIIGISMGQAVAGIVIGTAVGAAIALAIYLADRRRRG